MKLHIFKTAVFFTVGALVLASCTQMKDIGIGNEGNFSDTGSLLKDAIAIPIGAGINYSDMINDARYASIVRSQFNSVTFGYSMKHGAIVQNDGTYNYSQADALIAAVGDMNVFGHVLAWHSNQNARYIKSYAGLTTVDATELLSNNGFENGNAGWNVYNSTNATISFVTNNGANAHSGSGYMQVVNTVSNVGGQWRVQVASNEIPVTAGKSYTVSYYVRAASSGGSIRLSSQYSDGGGAQYQGDETIGTSWQKVTWPVVANSSKLRILFDMGLVANTYYIDEASVKEVIPVPSSTDIAEKVDAALNTYITNTVTHFKPKVHEWDVVNECMSPSGAFRTSANSTDLAVTSTTTDVFMWSDYLGRSYGLKAFQYAYAADPTAKLFINEYGLESNGTKLDSLIAYVSELRNAGAHIDGIGTQVHATINTSYALIDGMFKKLAATGLLVRISEVDIRANPNAKAGFILNPLLESYQAVMYKYIVNSYLTNVPKAQQAGITVWGVTDNTSWYYQNGADFPCIFNTEYGKKKAFAGVLQALKGE